MMNRRILMLLKSDCGNHAMIKIYHELLAQGLFPDICSISFFNNDLYDFENIDIKSINDVSIDDYDALIVTRNIFDYPISIEKIIHYKGLIISDNTTFYEGDDVFGDVVFTSGTNNYKTMRDRGVELPVIPVGCIKSNPNKSISNNKTILWIESGHFPFGQKGRTEIADIIDSICAKNPDYTLIVKPRYLPNDCKEANHYNVDHIYNYLKTVAIKRSNLRLLQTNCSLTDAIQDVQTVIHTYSSGFQEAIELNKEIINIGDISTAETVDLRHNRFQRIKDYIDRAECTVSKKDVLSILPRGFFVSSEFDGSLNRAGCSPIHNMVERIIDIIEKWYLRKSLLPGYYTSISQYDYKTTDKSRIERHRFCGALCHIVAKQEYYLDDFFSFIHLREMIKKNSLTEQQLDNRINDVIRTHFDDFNKSVFNQ